MRNGSEIWRPTRITGLSAVIGFWNTIAMPIPRIRANSRSAIPSSSTPSNITLPDTVATSGPKPTIDNTDSVLPDPDSPMMPSRSPRSTANETSSTTRFPPISTVRCSTCKSVTVQLHPGGRRAAASRPVQRSAAVLTMLVNVGDTVADRPRSCGSTASRRPSPRRLNPSVASTTARPGKTIAPGCTVTDCCRPSSIRPQDGVPTGVRPR